MFLTSYLPETRKKLRIDVEDIRRVNPGIIYVRGTGQGPRGPEAERGGYDGATWWCRGTLADSTMKVTGIDWPSGMIGHGDGMSGLTLAGGICAALFQRERTGVGRVVDGSLMGTAIWFNGPAIISTQFGDGGILGSNVPREERPPGMNTYRTKDGRFLILSMIGDHDPEWVDMCEHLNRPDLAVDPRFATSQGRAQHISEAVAIFDEIFSQRTLDEWKEALVTTKGVWSPVQNTEEIYDDPQTLANGFLRQVSYPSGPVALPVPPVLFDEDAGDPPRAPDFGEHTDSVLRETGYSEEEIEGYRQSGVIA